MSIINNFCIFRNTFSFNDLDEPKVSIDFLSAAMAIIEPLVRKLTTVLSSSSSVEIT